MLCWCGARACRCPSQDRSRPGDYQKAEGLTILPPEATLQVSPISELQSFLSPDNLAAMFKGSS
jgi:hypothetical protein